MINLLRFLRVELHPEYEHLKEFLTSMPLRFHNNEGKVIYKGRNELRVFEYQGQEYVVKSFKKPILINRIVYGILRPTKAKRSYNNALELLHIGICTPQPIGYVLK